MLTQLSHYFLLFLLISKYLSDNYLTTKAMTCKDLFNFTGNTYFLEASKSFYYLKELNIEGLKGKSASVEKYKMIRKANY